MRKVGGRLLRFFSTSTLAEEALGSSPFFRMILQHSMTKQSQVAIRLLEHRHDPRLVKSSKGMEGPYICIHRVSQAGMESKRGQEMVNGQTRVYQGSGMGGISDGLFSTLLFCEKDNASSCPAKETLDGIDYVAKVFKGNHLNDHLIFQPESGLNVQLKYNYDPPHAVFRPHKRIYETPIQTKVILYWNAEAQKFLIIDKKATVDLVSRTLASVKNVIDITEHDTTIALEHQPELLANVKNLSDQVQEVYRAVGDEVDTPYIKTAERAASKTVNALHDLTMVCRDLAMACNDNELVNEAENLVKQIGDAHITTEKTLINYEFYEQENLAVRKS